MSSIITGDASQSEIGLAATITGATNASPIAITTSAAHNYSTGDYVYISGVTGNTGANGVRKIVVTGASTFTLTGSSGTGAYVSGGTSLNLCMTPPCQVPSNGDDLDADAIAAALEWLADRTQYLALNSVNQSSTWSFTSNTSAIVARSGVYEIDCQGSGGSGGGGQAGGISQEAGGGGAAGGRGGRCRARVALSAGDVLTINIGASVSGGAGQTYGGSGAGFGTVGNTTEVLLGATSLCKAIGGGRGDAGGNAGTGATSYVPGGMPCQSPRATSFTPGDMQDGRGGWGRRVPYATQALATETIQAGGNSNCATGGTAGADGTKGSGAGGGGGGGGGASDWPGNVPGNGGAGGAGGATLGANATSGSNGTAGTYGAGGGGGGGGGGTNMGGTPGNGGSGGASGAGIVQIVYLGPVSV